MSQPLTEEELDAFMRVWKITSEDADIFEIMQRFRNDGSCESTIQQALALAPRLVERVKADAELIVELKEALELWMRHARFLTADAPEYDEAIAQGNAALAKADERKQS